MNLSPQKTYIRLPTTRQLTPTHTLFRMLRLFHATPVGFSNHASLSDAGAVARACPLTDSRFGGGNMLARLRGKPLRSGKMLACRSRHTAPAGQAEGLGSHRPRRRPPSPLLVGGIAPKPPLFVTPFYMKRGKSLCKHLITSSSILGIFWYERKTLYLEILKERGN